MSESNFREPSAAYDELQGWRRYRVWFSHSLSGLVFRGIVKKLNYRTAIYGMVLALVLLLILPIVMAATGLGSCSLHPHIPEWLKGTGVLFIVSVFVDFFYRLHLHIRQRGEVEGRNMGTWFNFAVNLFLILWWIIGSAWVYPQPWPGSEGALVTTTTTTTLPSISTTALISSTVSSPPTPTSPASPASVATSPTTPEPATVTTAAALAPSVPSTTAASEPVTALKSNDARVKREGPSTTTTTASTATTTAAPSTTPAPKSCSGSVYGLAYWVLTFGWLTPVAIIVGFVIYVFVISAVNS